MTLHGLKVVPDPGQRSRSSLFLSPVVPLSMLTLHSYIYEVVYSIGNCWFACCLQKKWYLGSTFMAIERFL